MQKKIFIMIIITLLVVGYLTLHMKEPEFSLLPPTSKIENPQINKKINYYNTFKKNIPAHIVDKIGKTPEMIHVTPEFIQLGRKTFYQETFGNEVFLTDILGLVNGPITLFNVAKAILQLHGKGTTNLRVELAKTVKVGGKTFKKGTKIDTGFDVPKGSYLPLGFPIKFSKGRFKVGISCAACHATVSSTTGKVIEGATNQDLNAGLLLGLATNSSALFSHAKLTPSEINALTDHLKKLPDPKKFEDLVDRSFIQWPKGTFDTTIDLNSNPTKIPDVFTANAHPYGWTGFASTGHFKGLTSFNNNVHAQNSDPFALVKLSKPLFGLPKNMLLGIMMQNAANKKYRYKPNEKETPEQFFSKVDPTPTSIGINESILPPSFPKATPIAPDGVIVSSPGFKAGEQVNATSAWQNTLKPPKAPVALDPKKVSLGEKVFRRANCISCHAGPALTNHQVIPVEIIKTEPSRAVSMKKTGLFFGKPIIYTPDTPVPIPPHAKTLEVPVPNPDQIKLSFAHGNSKGGYKVPSLKGLYWRAPYLHDAGVSVGANVKEDIGVTETLLKNKKPDPFNSLRALIDQNLRQKVIKANQRSLELQKMHVQGIGHTFWVDATTGFSKAEQDALIEYLMSK